MLRHHLVLALRSFRRTPLATCVGVLTLALGLTAFVAAYAFVSFWSGAERHFGNVDRTYVLGMHISTPSRPGNGLSARTPELAAEYLREDFPEIEAIARAIPIFGETMVATDRSAAWLAAVAVDAEFLEIFELPFVSGNPGTALSEPRRVVLTEAYAATLFGREDPIGQTLSIGNRVDATVTGVVGEVPEPSHMGRSAAATLRFDMLITRDVREALRAADSSAPPPDWRLSPAITYLLLPRDGSLTAETLTARLLPFVARHIPATLREQMDFELGVLPVRSLLADSVDARLFMSGRRISVSVLLLGLAGLVLGVACTNYAGLATARSLRRVREVGIRKSLGARPSQLVGQHLLEAAVLVAVALIVALIAFRLSAPFVQRVWGADPGAVLFSTASLAPFLIAVLAAVTLAAGGYPALVLSRLEPRQALAAARSEPAGRGMAVLLVGAQFAVASFLLIVVMVTALQNTALRGSGLTAADDPLILIENQSHLTHVPAEALRAELLAIPGVSAVTEMITLPWAGDAINLVATSPTPGAATHRVIARYVGLDYFSVFDVELLAGRVFSAERGEDVPSPERPMNIVVDRDLVTQFGLGSPEEAIGKEFFVGGVLRVIGVVETSRFNFTDDAPTLYRFQIGPGYNAAVRVARDDVAGTLDAIDGVWSRLAPNVMIRRHFINELFDRAYSPYRRIGLAFSGLASTAFLISALGLLGMATFVAGRRAREIGVRKTLGATTRGMVAMLVGSFSKPVVVANLAAWPAAYLAARAYLDVFAEPISLTPLPFVASLGLTLAIGCAAVGGQALRAASVRPADVLRAE